MDDEAPDGDGDAEGECGDGNIDSGEECDNGPVDVVGDDCLADCTRPGGLLAQGQPEEFVVNENLTITIKVGHAVAVDSQSRIMVLFESLRNNVTPEMRLGRLDDTLTAIDWSRAAPASDKPNLTIGPDDTLFSGGHDENVYADIRGFDITNGEFVSDVLSDSTGSILAVDAASSHIVAAGYQGAMGETGSIWYRNRDLAEDWQEDKTNFDRCGPIAISPEGRSWAICGPSPSLLIHDQGVFVGDKTIPLTWDHDELAFIMDHVYALGHQGSAFKLLEYDSDGESTDTTFAPYENASAGGFVQLSEDVLLVAGHVGENSAGLLAWYSTDGELLYAREIPGELDRHYPVAFFNDVAVDPEKRFAVAVGGIGDDPADCGLWIYKFEI